MIKRRFYRFEHGDRDAPSESSSTSDSELEAEATEESEEEDEEGEEEEAGNDNEDEIKLREKKQSHLSSSSGYESEDSSANDVNLDSSGLPTSDDDAGNQYARQIAMEGYLPGEENGEPDDIQQNSISKDGDLTSDLPDCAVKCKSVFKCRLCPRIVCLTEETLQSHLKSKRHARSEKLLKEGRLKLMLNDDGKIEGEAPKEKQALVEDEVPSMNKKGKKRHRFSKRLPKKKKGEHARFARKDSVKKRGRV